MSDFWRGYATASLIWVVAVLIPMLIFACPADAMTIQQVQAPFIADDGGTDWPALLTAIGAALAGLAAICTAVLKWRNR